MHDSLGCLIMELLLCCIISASWMKSMFLVSAVCNNFVCLPPIFPVIIKCTLYQHKNSVYVVCTENKDVVIIWFVVYVTNFLCFEDPVLTHNEKKEKDDGPSGSAH